MQLEIEVPDTTLTLMDEEWYAGFHRLNIHHEILEHTFGRAKRVVFNEFVRPFDMPAFYSETEHLLMIQGKKDVVLDLNSVIKEKTSELKIQAFKIDIAKIKPLLSSIFGTWFKMHAAHLRSAGLFGDHVDQSPEYREAEKTGDPGAVYVNYEFHDTLFMVQITSDGAVVLYQNITPDLEMDLLMDLKKSLLDLGRTD